MLAIILVLLMQANPVHTPGVVRPLTQQQVCTTKWGLDRRHVTEKMKRQVAANYGMNRKAITGKGACCEFDHRVPRELGGADDVLNIWPQPWLEARKKDRLENYVHRAVCRGDLTLKQGQAMFLGDWRTAYQQAGLP